MEDGWCAVEGLGRAVTKLLDKSIGTKIIYVPFKSGGEADVQLSGGHLDSHVNNPAESIGNWKAGKVRPLCVFNKETLAAGPKVTETQAWSDIPTCRSQGIGVEQFQQPRIASLPGKVPADAVAFYQALMKKVAETPEWKEYVARTAQTGPRAGRRRSHQVHRRGLCPLPGRVQGAGLARPVRATASRARSYAARTLTAIVVSRPFPHTATFRGSGIAAA